MKKLWLVAMIVACGAPPAKTKPGPWKLSQRVTLPTGADLQPDDPAKPGIAASQGVAFAHGKAFAVLGNLANYQPAGPSFVSIHDGQTLAMGSLVPLVKGNVRCTNAGYAEAAGETVLVACAGLISFDDSVPTDDGALVELSAADGTVQRLTVTGGSPGSVMRIGNTFWLGDLESPSLLRVNAETGTVTNGLGGAPALRVCRSGYVSALAQLHGRTFASCFNEDTIQEFDALTGATIGDPLPTGDGPVHMATFPDRITLVDSLSGTLSFILPTTPATVHKHAVFVAGTQGGNDVEGIAGNDSWAAAAGSGFGTLAIFDVTQDFKLVDSVDVKASPTSPTNDPYGVAFGDDAFFVAIAGWSQPGELVRVSQSTP